jgi:protein YIPF5/7
MLTSHFYLQSGKAQFNYIYGVGVMGSVAVYILLNLMSEHGIDAYRVFSVLGYCLLPMVGVSAISVMLTLEYVIQLVHPLYPDYARTVALLVIYFRFFL